MRKPIAAHDSISLAMNGAEGGPGRAISGLADALGPWADRGLLTIDDPFVAATQFNWLIMGEPINRAMFFSDGDPMPAPRRAAHIAAGVRVFLAAYGLDAG